MKTYIGTVTSTDESGAIAWVYIRKAPSKENFIELMQAAFPNDYYYLQLPEIDREEDIKKHKTIIDIVDATSNSEYKLYFFFN